MYAYVYKHPNHGSWRFCDYWRNSCNAPLRPLKIDRFLTPDPPCVVAGG